MVQEQFSRLYRKRYGMKIYYMRAFNHTGIGQNDAFVIPSWCKQAAEISKSGKPGSMFVGNLFVKRDFSNVKDIVRAYRLIIESNDCSNIKKELGWKPSFSIFDTVKEMFGY
ncbi:MAG: gmd1 [Anaerocolumna sp.]|nr:gmd1 [Anaerocolumna sp.]